MSKLKHAVQLSTEKFDIDLLDSSNYVGVDNLLPNKMGKGEARSFPKTGKLNSFNSGDILIGNIRPYLKKIWLADHSGGASPDVLVLRVGTNYDSNFIFQILKNDAFFGYIMRGSKGTKMPRGDKDHILEFDLPNVEFSIQKQYGNFYRCIDLLVRNNNFIINKHHDVLKRLYKYLFCNSISKNSKFQENQKLSVIVDQITTGLNPRSNFKLGVGENFYVTIKNIENGSIILNEKCDKIDSSALQIIQKRSKLEIGDVLFTSIEPVGLTYLIQEPPRNWNINESVFSIKRKKTFNFPSYLYYLLSSIEMKNYARNVSTGSIHKGIRHTELLNFEFTLPDRSFIRFFEDQASPILKEIHRLKQENFNLEIMATQFLVPFTQQQIHIGS